MHVGTAGETDIDAIRMLLDEQNAFHVGLLPGFFRLHPTDESRIRAVLEDLDGDDLVAEEDGEVLGLVELHLKKTKDLPILGRKTYAGIREMIVAEGCRERGIGSQLMEAARAWPGSAGRSRCAPQSFRPTTELAPSTSGKASPTS